MGGVCAATVYDKPLRASLYAELLPTVGSGPAAEVAMTWTFTRLALPLTKYRE